LGFLLRLVAGDEQSREPADGGEDTDDHEREKHWPPPGMAPATREPAIATPSEEPRLETLRDTPEMAPWTFSGHADCNRLTDAVSMIPTPTPMRNRPGR